MAPELQQALEDAVGNELDAATSAANQSASPPWSVSQRCTVAPVTTDKPTAQSVDHKKSRSKRVRHDPIVDAPVSEPQPTGCGTTTLLGTKLRRYADEQLQRVLRGVMTSEDTCMCQAQDEHIHQTTEHGIRHHHKRTKRFH